MRLNPKLKNGFTITIPVPNHKEIRTGTLMSIIRQSQIDRIIFETDKMLLSSLLLNHITCALRSSQFVRPWFDKRG